MYCPPSAAHSGFLLQNLASQEYAPPPSKPLMLLPSPSYLCWWCNKSRNPRPGVGVFVVQSLSTVQLFVTPLTAAHQASLSFTMSQSRCKFMTIESWYHLTLCHPLLLLPSTFPSIRVFSNESTLRIRWQKYWSFSFNISPSNGYSWLISFKIDSVDLLAV